MLSLNTASTPPPVLPGRLAHLLPELQAHLFPGGLKLEEIKKDFSDASPSINLKCH
jgi:hypothetical protein